MVRKMLTKCLLDVDVPLSDATPKIGSAGLRSSAQGTLEHRDGKHRVTRIMQPRISLKYGHDMEAAREAKKIYSRLVHDQQFDSRECSGGSPI